MDKKIFGRVSVNLPATIINDDGDKLEVTAVDTTGDIVDILCSLKQRDAIAPGGNFMVGGRPVQLSLILSLPDGKGKDASVQAKCHIVYSRRLSKEQCMVRMRYVDIESQSLSRLLRYLQQSSGFKEA